MYNNNTHNVSKKSFGDQIISQTDGNSRLCETFLYGITFHETNLIKH